MNGKPQLTSLFHTNAVAVFALLVFILTLPGCSNDMSRLESKIELMINKQDSNVPPPPKYEEFPRFTYISKSLRDPFQPPQKNQVPTGKSKNIKACKGPKPRLDRRRQPLEDYPLDSLRMVGTLERKGTRWALLRTKDGTIHRVRPDFYIGQNHGRITGILVNKILVQEIIQNRDNQYNNGCPYKLRPATIALSQ